MSPAVRFSRPAVSSFSRRSTRLDHFQLNIFEDHRDDCRFCEPLLYGDYVLLCIHGRGFARTLLDMFELGADGQAQIIEYNCQVSK